MLSEKYDDCLRQDQCSISRETSALQVRVRSLLQHACSPAVMLRLVRCARGKHPRGNEEKYLHLHLYRPWRCEHSSSVPAKSSPVCVFYSSLSSCWSFCIANHLTEETQALCRKVGSLLMVWSVLGGCWNGKQCINCLEGPQFRAKAEIQRWA